MKELPYITHDFGARNDPKLMDLQMDMGGQGLGIFWCLVEMLWENGGTIPANYKSIAFALRWCKPAEVEKVVTGYGLFEVSDGAISSHSATARIAEMRTYFGAKSASGKKGAERRWNGTANGKAMALPMADQCDANSTPIAQSMADQCDANGLTNILTNKQTNKHSINNTPLTAADFFEIFFFENVHDPAGEVHRFLAYYEDRGWKYQDGTPVKDFERAAKDWKPLKAGKRFDAEALRWYRAVWNAARNRVPEAADLFLRRLTNITRKDNKLALRFKDADTAHYVATFIIENDLAGDWAIDYRIEN